MSVHAYYREHFATWGFPALSMGETFAVQFLAWDFFCHFLQQDGSSQSSNGYSLLDSPPAAKKFILNLLKGSSGS